MDGVGGRQRNDDHGQGRSRRRMDSGGGGVRPFAVGEKGFEEGGGRQWGRF
ncbi:UNVERIFIED_CONTAM: hypothetical protein Sradi_2344500 [Sesamum radiatum]|uniref:Uncharacterized protein n=1 Tax=Sesamum radiatum TaxID=300843 RepID=A0AAW2T6P4_SESRA